MMNCYRPLLAATLFLLMACISCPPLAAQTRNQQRTLTRIAQSIESGGRQFVDGDFEKSAETIKDANARLERLLEGANPELIAAAQEVHARLTQARTLLLEKGEDPGEIAALPAPAAGQGETPAGDEISFAGTVAPILVAKCGRCHVAAARGGFDFSTYNKLIASTAVTDGNADQSRIVEVIVEGDMPKGGLTVTAAELDALKKWIAAGAKFDGDNPDTKLSDLRGAAPAPAPARRNREPEIQRATGNETVSFGLHVAPILMENCSGCHINTTNERGGLSMNDFRSLLRGGDSGAPLKPGKSMESLLFHRLTGANGAGIMPPDGQLSDANIRTIQTWIDEGARFDGPEPGTPIAVVQRFALSASQSHEELAASRQTLTMRNWQTVMSDSQPASVQSENFRVLGTGTEGTLREISTIAEGLVGEMQQSLQSGDGPLLKGNMTIYVFESRYDFSEFGTMIERQDIPGDVSSHWGFNTIDAYAVVLLSRNKSPDDLKVQLATAIGAAFTAGQGSDVPRWFADGTGHWLASRLFPRDPEVKQWEDRANEIIANMSSPSELVTGGLPEHRAALVSYLFVQKLRSDRGKFRSLLDEIRKGGSFDAAFARAYGKTPLEYLGGQPQGGRNNRRRR